MSRNIEEEKKSKKYKDAVELVLLIDDKYGFSPEGLQTLEDELRAMEPRELYDYLQDEWWRSWNGLIQEWENPE